MVLLVKEQYLNQDDFPTLIIGKSMMKIDVDHGYQIYLHNDLTSAYIGIPNISGLIPLGMVLFRPINFSVGIVREELVEVKEEYRGRGLATLLYDSLLSHSKISVIISDKTHFSSCKNLWKKLAKKGRHRTLIQVKNEVIKNDDGEIFHYNGSNFPEGLIWNESGINNDSYLMYCS